MLNRIIHRILRTKRCSEILFFLSLEEKKRTIRHKADTTDDDSPRDAAHSNTAG